MLLKRTVLNYWMKRISIYCETLQATVGLDSEGKTGIPNCKKVETQEGVQKWQGLCKGRRWWKRNCEDWVEKGSQPLKGKGAWSLWGWSEGFSQENTSRRFMKCTNTHTGACTYMSVHTWIHTHTRAYTQVHAHMNTSIYTKVHTHEHTHTWTHIPYLFVYLRHWFCHIFIH